MTVSQNWRFRPFAPASVEMNTLERVLNSWISARRTVNALAEISSFSDDSGISEESPADDVSEWLETIYDRDEQLQQLTNEALRLEAEEDVDRLLESD